MRLLLDTQIWIWMEGFPERLSRRQRTAVTDGRNQLFLSAASGWEIAIKFALRKLDLPAPPDLYLPERLTSGDVSVLPVLLPHALRVAQLPLHHADPFDRLLVAQAQLEGLTLVTADRRIAAYDVEILGA